MRDRLIELLNECQHAYDIEVGEAFMANRKPIGENAFYADCLLTEGVIVPPVKVGSDVYFADHENKLVWGGELVSFSLDAAHLWFNCHYKCGLNIWHPIEDFGKTVFLTREEAEKALVERREG